MAVPPPLWLQERTYPARVDRQLFAALLSEGVSDIDEGGLLVTERGSGANMSVDVAPGFAIIEGDNAADQGNYFAPSDPATTNLVISAAHGSLDRIDLVVFQVRDSTEDGGVDDDGRLLVVAGTPDPAPIAPAVPDNSIPLAEIHVEAGTTTIVDGDITDLRVAPEPRAFVPWARRELRLAWDVRDFGTLYDDSPGVGVGTDNGPLLAAATAALKARGAPARLVFPQSAIGYRFLTGTYVEDFDGLEIDLGGSNVINEAFLAPWGNNLITVRNCDDFTFRDATVTALATGDFSGGRNPTKCVEFGGIIRRGLVEDLHAIDHQNFALTYGETDPDSAVCRIEGLTFRRIRITGDCGPIGDGSGINVYPRTDDATPASFGVVFEDIYIDVSRGSTDRADHGPQGIKVNNIDGVTFLGVIDLVGGNTSALTITNGCRNVRGIGRLITRKANRGLNVNCDTGTTVVAITENVAFDHLEYYQDGITGSGVEGWGLYIGQVADFRLGEGDLEGDVQFEHLGFPHAFARPTFGKLVLHSSNLETVDPGSVEDPMVDLSIGEIHLLGNGIASGSGRCRIGRSANWKSNRVRIGKVVTEAFDTLAAIDLYGDDADVGPMQTIGGNPSDTASVSAVTDRGDRNIFGPISLDPATPHFVDWHYRRTVTGNGTILGTAGTPSTGVLEINAGTAWVRVLPTQDIPYAAGVLIDPLKGEFAIVGALTGNITFTNPVATTRYKGQRLTVQVTQDATGGRTVTWGTQFAPAPSAVNAAADAVTVWSFVYDGTRYRQV